MYDTGRSFKISFVVFFQKKHKIFIVIVWQCIAVFVYRSAKYGVSKWISAVR